MTAAQLRHPRKDPEMRILMLKTRNYTPPADRRLTVKYLEGQEYTVKRAWALDMIADGDAKRAPAPKRRPD